jgi:hypothetical protein
MPEETRNAMKCVNCNRNIPKGVDHWTDGINVICGPCIWKTARASGFKGLDAPAGWNADAANLARKMVKLPPLETPANG